MNMVVHARVKPELVPMVRARVKKIFVEIEQAQPRGVALLVASALRRRDVSGPT
jgi:hypothetical protein